MLDEKRLHAFYTELQVASRAEVNRRRTQEKCKNSFDTIIDTYPRSFLPWLLCRITTGRANFSRLDRHAQSCLQISLNTKIRSMGDGFSGLVGRLLSVGRQIEACNDPRVRHDLVVEMRKLVKQIEDVLERRARR
jgi:hypothetical protein